MKRRRKPFSTQPAFELGGFRWAEVDWHILILAFLLLGFGLVFLAAMANTEAGAGRGGIKFDDHLKKLAVALPAIAFGFLLRPKWLRSQTWWVYGATILLLALVPIVGE
ncbi:MAG: hypothetical protein AAF368_11825, partial [Planctomycetota bacterium]